MKKNYKYLGDVYQMKRSSGQSWAEAAFNDVREARSVLSDAGLREQYDDERQYPIVYEDDQLPPRNEHRDVQQNQEHADTNSIDPIPQAATPPSEVRRTSKRG